MNPFLNHCVEEWWETGDVDVNAGPVLANLLFKPSPQSQNPVKRHPSWRTSYGDSRSMKQTMIDDSSYVPLSCPRRTSLSETENGQFAAKDDSGGRALGFLPMVIPSKMAIKDCREHSPHDWELRKNDIKQLYVIEKKQLREVVKVLKDQGFAATERQFKKRIKDWEFDRNIKTHEMEAMIRKKLKRKTFEGKETAFTLRGLPVEAAKIDRYLRQRRKSSFSMATTISGHGERLPSDGLPFLSKIGTPPSLRCNTPTALPSPPQTHDAPIMTPIATPVVLPTQLALIEKISGTLRSPDKLEFIGSYQPASWWSPRSYLQLCGFDEASLLDNEPMQQLLQGIIHRLCTLVLPFREHLISGPESEVAGMIDKILALGKEAPEFSTRTYKHRQKDLATSTSACNRDWYIMIPFLRRLYLLLETTQGLRLTNEISGTYDVLPLFSTASDSGTPDPIEIPSYESFLGYFTTGILDTAPNGNEFDEFLSGTNDTESWDTANSLAALCYNSEQDNLAYGDLEDFKNARLSNSVQPFRPKLYSKHILGNQNRRNHCYRHRIFSISRATAFGRIDIVIRVKYVYTDDGTTPTGCEATEDEFEAQTIITPFKSSLPIPQMVFNVREEIMNRFDSLSLPTLLFRPRIPDDSHVFEVVKYGKPHDLELMIENGLASLNDCSTKGRSLLNHALGTTNLTMCKYLIEKGAEVDSIGDSDVVEADWERRPDCYQSMLEAGADPSVLFFDTEIGGSFLTSSYSMELIFGPAGTLRALLDVGIPFISPDSTGNGGLEEPPILILARSTDTRNDAAAKFALLIERGADPNVRDNEGSSSLHIIMGRKHLPRRYIAEKHLPDILMTLVTGGTDVFATNYHGDTVSHAALQGGFTYIWKQVLEDCGYTAEAVMSYSPLWTVGLSDQQEEALLSQRSKLSLQDYFRRRSPLLRVEELESGFEDGSWESWESDTTGWWESEQHYSQGFAEGELGDEGAELQDREQQRDSGLDAVGDGPAAEEDYMALFTVDDWGYVLEE